MKALLVILALAAGAHAQSTVIIYQRPQTANVVSPLTTPTAQANQALLGQIKNTMQQRYFEHQVLTLQTSPAILAPINTPRIIRAK